VGGLAAAVELIKELTHDPTFPYSNPTTAGIGRKWQNEQKN
jgi:hypothetical protein